MSLASPPFGRELTRPGASAPKAKIPVLVPSVERFWVYLVGCTSCLVSQLPRSDREARPASSEDEDGGSERSSSDETERGESERRSGSSNSSDSSDSSDAGTVSSLVSRSCFFSFSVKSVDSALNFRSRSEAASGVSWEVAGLWRRTQELEPELEELELEELELEEDELVPELVPVGRETGLDPVPEALDDDLRGWDGRGCGRSGDG